MKQMKWVYKHENFKLIIKRNWFTWIWIIQAFKALIYSSDIYNRWFCYLKNYSKFFYNWIIQRIWKNDDNKSSCAVDDEFLDTTDWQWYNECLIIREKFMRI